jgi:hypothetical protein
MAEATETQKRTCRVCGETYDYPGHKSLVTRFHCERCVGIPEDIQRLFEIYRRRIDRLGKELDALKSKGS